MVWNFACPDWRERLKDGRSLVPDLPLDSADVARAVEGFNRLRLPDVPGTPTMEEAAGDWFRDIVGAVFGSMVGGVRMVPEVFCLVPKKNSKTTGGAGIMDLALILNERPEAEFYFVGPTQEVAELAFNQAAGMIRLDDELSDMFKIREHKKEIEDLNNGATLKVISFDANVSTGKKVAGVLIDEVHLLGNKRNGKEVMAQLRGGTLSIDEAFIIMLTTQSDKKPAGVFKSELQAARDIRDGKDPTGRTLSILYEFPIEMQVDEKKPWADSKNWPMVTPNLNRSIRLEKLEQLYDGAKKKGGEDLRIWASQHLNIEVGIAIKEGAWKGAPFWEAQADETLRDLDELIERCEVLVTGADGGGLDDLFGLCVAGREIGTRRWLYWFKAWCHQSAFEQRQSIASELEDFVEEGTLILCDHATQDIEEICDVIEKVHDTGKMPEEAGIGLDPAGIGVLLDELASRDLVEPLITGVAPQGYKLTSAVWSLERKLADKTAVHDGSELMKWCVGNARAEIRGQATHITKQTSGTGKIDPLIAGFIATKLLERNPAAKPVSVWDALARARAEKEVPNL